MAQGDNSAGIVLRDVSHVYRGAHGPITVLDGISLAIRRGEFLALVGPSGCGKTTILDLMSGLVRLQSGTAAVGGRPPAEGRPDTARMFARDPVEHEDNCPCDEDDYEWYVPCGRIYTVCWS